MQRLLLLIAAAALMVTPAIGADISGTWTASFETQLGVQNYTYTFKVAGSKLTGTAKSNLAEGTIDGTVNGDDVTFVENLNYEGMPLQIQYKARSPATRSSSLGSWWRVSRKNLSRSGPNRPLIPELGPFIRNMGKHCHFAVN